MILSYKKPFFFLAIMVFLLPITATALEVSGYPSFLGTTLAQDSSPIDFAKYLFSLGISIAGTLALLAVTLGGILYLTSFARSGFASEGKAWIKAGITGLLILMCAYLIAYTVNPALVSFKLGDLNPVKLLNLLTGQGDKDQVPAVIYQEIPLGLLTENLMSKEIYCYDFDPDGNPLPMPLQTDRDGLVAGPTYKNHDRVDCALKLMDAAQKKSEIIAALSEEIKKLMETCKCDGTKCTSTTKNFCQLKGGAGCTPGILGNQDTCQAADGTDGNCCDAATKNKIEHGKIKIGADPNNNIAKREYNGLDEFRCPNNGTPCSDISAFVENKVQVEKQDVVVIVANKWNQLNLVQQFYFLKEKITEMQTKIKKDLDQLDEARNSIAQCRYLIKSSADFARIKETTPPTEKRIEVKKTFVDSETNSLINTGKYCKGFNYSNSSCFRDCQDRCPDTSPQVLECYRGCESCKPDDSKCLERQKTCVNDCYNSRPCPFTDSQNNSNSPGGSYKDFQGCISSCRQECTQLCAMTYLPGSNDFGICVDRCGKNSKCVMENLDKCVTNPPSFRECASSNSDLGNIENCIEGSYLCNYGSYQYAGYKECLRSTCPWSLYLTPVALLASDCTLESKQQEKYSSSYLYQNPSKQKCFGSIFEQILYKVGITEQKKIFSCFDSYPEAAKCTFASKCPACPCNEVDETIVFDISAPKAIIPPKDNVNDNPGAPGYVPGGGGAAGGGGGGGVIGGGGSKYYSVKITDYTLVTGQCTDYAYNNDPLTFYCRIGWESEGYKSGQWSQCSKTDEIPVGQAVDDARAWATNLLGSLDSFVDGMKKMADDIKKIEEKQPNEYCRCDSKLDNNKPVCTSSCKYIPRKLIGADENGVNLFSDPKCELTACKGNSCQQMIDYLTKVSENYQKIRMAFIDFDVAVIKEGRTDPLKELTYSRKQMDACGQQSVQLGNDAVGTISCSMAYPGTGYLDKRCYGILDGSVKNPPQAQTDNWFCCKTLLK